jgi:hypothetical protein
VQHVARIVEMRTVYRILLAKTARMRPFGGHRRSLEITLKEHGVRVCTGFNRFRVRVAGSCEHGNEHFSSINGVKFANWLSDHQFLQTESAPYCANIHTYIHTHVHIYTHIHTYIHTHVHIYTHTYIHTHLYIHTHEN